MKHNKNDDCQRIWICDYGTRHPLSVLASECGCNSKFGVEKWDFIEWMNKSYGVKYVNDITESMQNEFLRANSLK